MALPTPLHSLKIEGCDALRSIPKSVIKNPSLEHLYIINCCSLESFPKGKAKALKILYIRNCKKLDFPLANKKIHLDALEDLSVGSSCDSLTDLSLHLFPKLRSLSIWDCAKLQKLSMPQNSQKKLTSLEALEIRDRPNLEDFPTGGLLTPNLKSIWFSNCKRLKKLPDQLGTFEYLKSMFINDCPELETLSIQVLPSKLSLLRINFCNKLIPRKEWGLHELDSLCQLEIEGECKDMESFPVEELLPSNLSSLRISGLSDLKKFTGLKKLESIKTLEISCCYKLQFLPDDGFPSSLSFLCIKECPLLKPKLQNKNREDWSKIAHISCVEIDEEVIS
ncbi:putative disease resistance protein At3g14460 [Quercus lobata]|uniref:CC-NBS-LRR protein n=1 Tax=Quercus lobata TaxID=97700 RepID=A0A7N2LEH6_QUELO|nr:putative disease resistance protein At3g14460 [Quercus lobata]